MYVCHLNEWIGYYLHSLINSCALGWEITYVSGKFRLYLTVSIGFVPFLGSMTKYADKPHREGSLCCNVLSGNRSSEQLGVSGHLKPEVEKTVAPGRLLIPDLTSSVSPAQVARAPYFKGWSPHSEALQRLVLRDTVPHTTLCLLRIPFPYVAVAFYLV